MIYGPAVLYNSHFACTRDYGRSTGFHEMAPLAPSSSASRSCMSEASSSKFSRSAFAWIRPGVSDFGSGTAERLRELSHLNAGD